MTASLPAHPPRDLIAQKSGSVCTGVFGDVQTGTGGVCAHACVCGREGSFLGLDSRHDTGHRKPLPPEEHLTVRPSPPAPRREHRGCVCPSCPTTRPREGAVLPRAGAVGGPHVDPGGGGRDPALQPPSSETVRPLFRPWPARLPAAEELIPGQRPPTPVQPLRARLLVPHCARWTSPHPEQGGSTPESPTGPEQGCGGTGPRQTGWAGSAVWFGFWFWFWAGGYHVVTTRQGDRGL